jgi:hypothetical protein
MPIYPIRGLSTKGILKDPASFDLGQDAWSAGLNVFFDGNFVSRAPVFREVSQLGEFTVGAAYIGNPTTPIGSSAYAPAFVVGYRPPVGYDYVFITDNAGRIQKFSSGVITAVSPAGYTPTTQTSQFTSAFVAGVAYINNPSAVPLWFGPSSTVFASMASWSSTWSCASLRPYKDYLVALNVTKGAVSYPTMVKTSDNTLFGQVPGSWDQTNQTTNATENILSDMSSPIVDGLALRDMFVVYGQREAWQMQSTSGQSVFDYYRLPIIGGLISQNCVVEVEGYHYCFGPHDIYRHNGLQQASLVENKNRSYIFGSLNTKLANRCFVQFSPEFKTILFAYVSSDADVTYTSPTGCNRGFVLNLSSGAHSFVDLPNVTSMSVANLNSIAQWNTAGSLTWFTVGGSWYDQVDNYGDNTVVASQALPGLVITHRLAALDFMDNGSLAFPYIPELNTASYVQRTGIDLDEVGANVTDYKIISRVFPEVTMIRPNINMTIQLGSQIYAQSPVVWDVVNVYDPRTNYKVDCRVGGRFLAYRFSMVPAGDFRMSGFDVEIVAGGSK